MPLFTKLGKYNNTALFILRVGIGAFMVLRGYPKMLGGPEKWTKLGNNMSLIGVKVYPEIWGFLAASSECIGGVFLLLGFFFRPSCFFLLFTMFIAAMSHLSGGGELLDSAHAIELGVVFLALFIMGPGKYSIDKA